MIRIHHFSIQNPPDAPCFTMIQNGTKRVEGRINKPKYHDLEVDDIIDFECNGKHVFRTIDYIHQYNTLLEYLQWEGLKNALPNVTSLDEAIEIYNRFNTEREREECRLKYGSGFLGIGLGLGDETSPKTPSSTNV